MSGKTIQSVLKEHGHILMAIHGVSGIAQGKHKGKPCVKVFVVRKDPDILCQIPSTIEGYDVLVEESGTIQALGI